MAKWFVLGCCLVVLAATAHCGGGPLCQDGATQRCVCFDGRDGAQLCLEGGSRWGVCRCEGSGDAGTDRQGQPPVCQPGATQACVCSNGGKGAQSCAKDGASWQACGCDEVPDKAPPEPPPTPDTPTTPEPREEPVAELPDLPQTPDRSAPELPIETTPDAPGPVDTRPPPIQHDPILFIHGINGSKDDSKVMRQRLTKDGWPANLLFAYTFKDPRWGCNKANADTIKAWVADILQKTGRTHVDIVAHSMGTLSSRYYIKNLGGAASVNTYVTLGGMHHGLSSSCSPDFPFKPCVWKEICSKGDFVKQLNATPATPGKVHWVSIYGDKDTTVPNSSSRLKGAENIEIKGASHDGKDGVTEHPKAYSELKRVLQYPLKP